MGGGAVRRHNVQKTKEGNYCAIYPTSCYQLKAVWNCLFELNLVYYPDVKNLCCKFESFATNDIFREVHGTGVSDVFCEKIGIYTMNRSRIMAYRKGGTCKR